MKIGEMIRLEWFRQNQLDIMLFLTGVCAAITFCGLFASASKYRKTSLLMMGLSATILLAADRLAYIYRGDESVTGFWMVRICNFLVFAMTITVAHTFNIYLIDLYKNELKVGKLPFRFRITEITIFLGYLLIIVSQFTGLYYTFDESNRYQRSDLFFIGYIIPLIAFILQFSINIQYRRKLPKNLFAGIMLFTLLPIAASIAQFFLYGISLTNMTIVGLAVMLRICELINARKNLDAAKQREITLLKQEQESMHQMVEQTAYALAEAIDAKDSYTRGHSMRVAEYSAMIARKLGWSEEKCKNIYFIGLLHDVGKIGIPQKIINKETSLTDEEYELVKSHTVKGYQILSKISKYPDLSLGAHYHHERYDGRGYPEGLKGEEIPEKARIIAVADAYDAMASKRSYRDVLPQAEVREKIAEGVGTQFDPVFARIMLELIDQDTDYDMRQK